MYTNLSILKLDVHNYYYYILYRHDTIQSYKQYLQ